MNIHIKSKYQVAARSIFTMLAVAALLVLPSGCSNDSDPAGGGEQTTLTPLGSIKLKTSVSTGVASTRRAVTTRGTDLYYNYYMVEASFEGHDGSSADKPISVGYYRSVEGVDYTTLENLSVGKGALTDLNLAPISVDDLATVGITPVGTQANGSLLVPASGEFNLRLHGYAAPLEGGLPTNMNAVLLQGWELFYESFYTFWTGKAKMNGTSLIATADLAAADGSAPANGAILLRYPYARVNFNVIGAYGESTAAQPYLASSEFSVFSSLVSYPLGWSCIPQSSGESGFQTSWFRGEANDYFSSNSTENLMVYGLAISQANKESIAANGAYYKEGQTLFTLRGRQADAYKDKTYEIVVPTGGITFWAGHIYTYTIRLTESKAIIESVTVSGFTNDGDYSIDLNGNVTGGNPT